MLWWFIFYLGRYLGFFFSLRFKVSDLRSELASQDFFSPPSYPLQKRAACHHVPKEHWSSLHAETGPALHHRRGAQDNWWREQSTSEEGICEEIGNFKVLVDLAYPSSNFERQKRGPRQTTTCRTSTISVSHKPEVNYLAKNKIVWPTSPQKLANLGLYYFYVKYRWSGDQ